MTRRRRPGISPTLFPFLAVLVCTLGTLILLLALVAQKAEESAQELVESESESARQLAEQQVWEAEQLIAFRDKQTAEMENRRGELGHLEENVRRLREQLQSLNRELEAADNQLDSAAIAKAEAQLADLEAQIAQEQAVIADLNETADGGPPRVVIVPYAGTNGTQRRPIYLECTDEAIIIQPEGVRITADQLAGPLGPGNPIDAALRANRDYWQKLETNAPPPYPLLLVRPGGIHAYAACRIAMDAWDDQFGYELVPADLELAFPKPDPQLRETLVAAVDDAIRRSRAKIAAAPARYNQFAGGGGAPTNGVSSPVLGGQTPYGTDYGTSSTAGGKPNSPASVDGLGSTTELGATAQSGSSEMGLGSADEALSDLSTSQRLPRADSDLLAGGPNQTGMGKTGLGFNDGSASSSTDTSLPGLNGPTNSTAGEGDSAPPGSTELSAAQLQTGSDAGSTEPGSTLQSQNIASGDFTSGDNPLGHSGASGKSGQVNASSGSSATTISSGSASAAASGAAAGSAASMPSQQPPPRTFSEVVKDQSRIDRSAAARGNPDQLPDLSSDNNWALPSSMKGMRGPTMVRELRLQCGADKLVLAGERGGPATTVAIRDGLIEQSVRELAVEIRQRVEGWGSAMRNGRWEPVLSVEVLPGGDARFRQLETLMRNSGVRVERRKY